MNPKKANFIVNKAFRHCCNIGYRDDTKAQPLLAVFNTPEVKEAVTKLISDFIRDDKDLCDRWEIPYTETSCYYDVNIESVVGNLHYIQDRWRCTGRLKYLRDMLSLVE
ncbi:hypothetical protein M0R04_14850 [Candidatus Dojkabacteria bacterium]|jgi:hypothetical protein|nr:hypothetical protein [Candidatus Dojkabacteria bacterium]